jgi:hypothetical protein
MGPGTVRDRRRSLVLFIDCAGGDKRGNIWNYSRPPKALSHEGQGPTIARVKGKEEWEEWAHSRTAEREQRQAQTSGYPPRFGWDCCASRTCFPIPQPNAVARNKMGRMVFGLRGGNRRVIAARQGIWLDVLGSQMVGVGKVEPGGHLTCLELRHLAVRRFSRFL